MEGIRATELEAISDAIADLGSVNWELALDPDKDEWKEYNRVAAAFVEPEIDPQDEDHFEAYVNQPGWTKGVINNIEFPNQPEKFKEFLELLEKLGY